MTVLLTGGSGTLGTAIRRARALFPPIVAPPRSELDITDAAMVESVFGRGGFDAVIHCAALARVAVCERDPDQARRVNVDGTRNLVAAAASARRPIRFLHISTDGVYDSVSGNHREDDEPRPYNVYGATKLEAERAVATLAGHCIIRTSFFDETAIPFADAATDAYSSKLPVSELAGAIAVLLASGFVGVINVGGERRSNYDLFKAHKPDLKETTFAAIQAAVPVPLARDSSMNIDRWTALQSALRRR
jgi:dTDP-4-dehydrorhamnose reductase